jgi:hypothetical protein
MILTRRFGALRARPQSQSRRRPSAAERRPVHRYGDRWMLVAAVTATVGVWVALQTWPALALLGAFACAAMVGGSLAEAVRQRGRTRLRVLLDAGLAGIAAIAAAGLLGLFGTWGILGIAFLAVTCPPLWVAALGRRKRSPTPVPTPQVPTEPRLLDDHALCGAWRKSFTMLEHPTSPARHLWVVQQRQLLLDELERRNPTGLSAWLASGAQAAGDPAPYIVPRRG